MDQIDPVAVLRMALILTHLLAFAVAAAGTAFGDFAIFARQRVDTELLHQATQAVAGALALLWLSGLAIIGLDTGFALDALAQRPKLLAKLTVVAVLTLNGAALHLHVFDRLSQPQANPLCAASLPSVLGAVSAASWLYAAFVGVAKAVTPLLGYGGFMALYGLTLAVAVAVALTVVRPRLASRLTPAPWPATPGRGAGLQMAALGADNGASAGTAGQS